MPCVMKQLPGDQGLVSPSHMAPETPGCPTVMRKSVQDLGQEFGICSPVRFLPKPWEGSQCLGKAGMVLEVERIACLLERLCMFLYLPKGPLGATAENQITRLTANHSHCVWKLHKVWWGAGVPNKNSNNTEVCTITKWERWFVETVPHTARRKLSWVKKTERDWNDSLLPKCGEQSQDWGKGGHNFIFKVILFGGWLLWA